METSEVRSNHKFDEESLKRYIIATLKLQIPADTILIVR